MWQDIAAIIMGPLIIYSWWVQTYTDSWVAELGRSISRERMTKNMAAMTCPCMGIALTLGGIGMLSHRAGAPEFVIVSTLSIALLFLFIGFVYILPFPLPRLIDSRYQFMKRNGLLDDNGDPLPDEEAERILAQREENE
ncbi:MAG: hypothetical protein KH264_06245 [Actinomyces graevenitzii]|nr:hypothetical protein [Actinomyces graevenitzii]